MSFPRAKPDLPVGGVCLLMASLASGSDWGRSGPLLLLYGRRQCYAGAMKTRTIIIATVAAFVGYLAADGFLGNNYVYEPGR
ncbi:hypothetical protein CA54_16670 [Symmachiella macrocystis]|uniref:Uncharacterized protein n=1 Tax=Symmachiella macrocystis TaxID=2527985 RepID=A0A5C6BN39_9PLAN|nr:hypothetical protein CA54_16670 [Symmachiella macrocystis]